jgi:hypothetical protein
MTNRGRGRLPVSWSPTAPAHRNAGNTASGPVPTPGPPGTVAQRWLARLSFMLAAAAAAIGPAFTGLRSLLLLPVGLAAVAVSLASGYLFLARRGLLRWLALAVFVLAPVAVIVAYAFAHLLWVALASAAGWLLAGATVRLALAGRRAE